VKNGKDESQPKAGSIGRSPRHRAPVEHVRDLDCAAFDPVRDHGPLPERERLPAGKEIVT